MAHRKPSKALTEKQRRKATKNIPTAVRCPGCGGKLNQLPCIRCDAEAIAQRNRSTT